MSDFLKKLEAKKKRSSATESMTIRVTAEEDAAIKELANVYECTRQELIHDLITEYLIPAWKKLESESLIDEIPHSQKIEGKPLHYVLNTNKINSMEDHEFMLRNGIAAAFEDGYKEKINRFQQGDVIFLYESGKGIVAYGQASGETEKKEHNGKPAKTYFQRLEGFEKLSKPIAAKEICQILNRKIRFAQVLTYLSDGKKLLNAISQQ